MSTIQATGTVSAAGQVSGQLGVASIILNDWTITLSEIEGGHRLTATRGSSSQSMDIMDGKKGDALRFEDLTPEQQAQLKGPKGDKGDPGEKGEPGAKGDKEETIYELGDLVYHAMVLMTDMGISMEEVVRELAKRHVIDHKVKQERMQ